MISKIDHNHISLLTPLFLEMLEYHSNFNETFNLKSINTQDLSDFIKDYLNEENCSIYCFFYEEKIIGYVLARKICRSNWFNLKDKIFIEGLYVTHSHRRKGIGEKLVNYIQNNTNVSYIELDVVIQNIIGVNFWKKNGFMENTIKLYKIINNNTD